MKDSTKRRIGYAVVITAALGVLSIAVDDLHVAAIQRHEQSKPAPTTPMTLQQQGEAWNAHVNALEKRAQEQRQLDAESDSLNAADPMQGIENQVAADAVEQYRIAERQGNRMQICVQAGFVSAAFLQAKDESNYRIWKDTERQRCGEAGVPQ